MNFTPQEIYLNSEYATMSVNGDYNSDMLFYFDNPIVKPTEYSISLRVSSFVFPVSFTIIDDSNNEFIVDGVSYIIPSGNYNALSFMSYLLDLIPSEYTMSFSTITLKYTINNSSSDFTIDGTCLSVMGFTGSSTSTSKTLTSDGMVNFSGTNMIYVDVPNISTSNLSSRSGQKTSILKSIPVSVDAGDLLFYTDATSSMVYLQEESITFFHIRLLGEDLTTPVNFNGQHWNMTLEVSFIQKDNITPLTKMDFGSAYQKYLKENILYKR